jgi:hypothetical protein
MTYDLDLYLRVLQLRPANALALPEVLAMYRRHPAQMSRDWRTLQHDWEMLLAKYAVLAPDAVRRQARRANTQMYRYFATVAYERRDFGGGLNVLLGCLRRDPFGFMTSPRHWRVFLSCLAGRLLPGAVHRRLEALAGLSAFAAHGGLQYPTQVKETEGALVLDKEEA